MDSLNNKNLLTNFIKIQTLLSRANEVLRKVFLERWAKYSGSEWDSSSVKTFRRSEIGAAVLDKIQKFPIQRKYFESGDVDKWDLTLLTDILMYTNFPSDSKQEKTSEKAKLEELKKIRNKLAHSPVLGVENEKFQEMWEKISAILISIGCLQEDLDAIKFSSNLSVFQDESSSGRVNQANSEEAKRLKMKANDFYKNGEFKKAVEIYSQAISLSGLLESEMAILYSNRSLAYLSIAGKNNRHMYSEELHCGLQDGKEAVKLNPTWYRGYFQTANANYELGKFMVALQYYDFALNLSPDTEELLLARDNCRMKLAQETRHEHMDPSGIPTSEAEQIKKIQTELGGSVSDITLADAVDQFYKTIPGGTYVLQAHRSASGIGATKDPEMAAKLYAKGATLGNSEAMYNLGILHKDGVGVKQDFKMFIKLMKTAAAQPHRLPGMTVPDAGVAEAEYSLGLAFEEGLGVTKDFSEAAAWYKKSSDHGCGGGSNNLALLYLRGQGVSMSVDIAVQYWKLAASKGESLAMRSLAIHYLKSKKDPLEARKWHELAIKHGNLEAQLDATEFEGKLKVIEKENNAAMERKLLEWEQEAGLTSKGMSFKYRLKRMERGLKPVEAVVDSLTLADLHVDKDIENSTAVVDIDNDFYQFDETVLQKYAQDGSTTANRILTAISHFKIVKDLISKPDLCETSEQIIHELARCYRTEQLVVQLTPAMKEQLGILLTAALKSNATSELDKDARICFGYLLTNSLHHTFSFVEKAKQKYPNEKALHVIYLQLCSFVQTPGIGLQESEKSLKLFPKDIDLLQCKASCTRLESEGLERVISAYEEFLQVAPPDHRKVPESYYTMACEYFLKYVEKNPDQTGQTGVMDGVTKMEEYYRLGLEAEKVQLPCFLPYECNQKTRIEDNQHLIDAIKSKINCKQDVASKIPAPISPTVSQPEPDYNMLSDPSRVLALKSHRLYVLERRQILCSGRITLADIATKPTHTQRAPSQLFDMKPITFREMNTLQDKVYEGYVIQVTSVDDAGFGVYPSILLLLEDENKNLLRCFIHDYPDTDEKTVQEKYGFGAKMSILNPYMRIAKDGFAGLRVDDMASLYLHPQMYTKKRCRFCGREDEANLRCANCKKANYCSRKCQTMDWKLAKHKLICAPL